MPVKMGRGVLWLGLLLLAVAVAVATAFFQTQFFIETLVSTTNKSAVTRSEQLVESAFRSLHTQLENVAIDNSHWDEAVKNAYHNVDDAWLQTNWKETTAQAGYVYDTSLILNGMTGQTIAAFYRGQPLAKTFESLLGEHGHELLMGLPTDPNTSAVSAGFVSTEHGLAIAAMAPIVPYEASLRVTTFRPNYLILIKHLDTETLANLSKQFLLNNLTAELPKDTNTPLFKVAVGQTSLHPRAKWKLDVVGDGLRKELWSTASTGLSILLSILLGLAFICWLFIRKVASSRDAALLYARQDTLTGLANRVALREFIDKSIKAKHPEFSIAFCDLDGFKAVNDTYGHNVGDELLIHAAQFISGHCGKNDNVFRLGGDEFVVFFAGPDNVANAIGFAKNAASAIAEPVQLCGHSIDFGISIGVTTAKSSETSFVEVLRRADTAMYAAKKHPETHWCRYEDIVSLQELRRLIVTGNRSEKELAAKIA